MKRYAIVIGLGATFAKVASYLPGNYKVIWEGIVDEQLNDHGVVIEGVDRQGWTLDAYVIPRLGSGLMACREIDLSHPVMKQIPLIEDASTQG